MTSTYEEAFTQSIALKHSLERYLLIDISKVDKGDFVSFFKLTDLTAVITNPGDEEKIKQLSTLTEVIC